MKTITISEKRWQELRVARSLGQAFNRHGTFIGMARWAIRFRDRAVAKAIANERARTAARLERWRLSHPPVYRTPEQAEADEDAEEERQLGPEKPAKGRKAK